MPLDKKWWQKYKCDENSSDDKYGKNIYMKGDVNYDNSSDDEYINDRNVNDDVNDEILDYDEDECIMDMTVDDDADYVIDKGVLSEYSKDCDEDVYDDENVLYNQEVRNDNFVLQSDYEYRRS